MNVQGQFKFKWACVIKHLADADIPNAKAQCQIKASLQSVFIGKALETTLKKAIQRCKPKSEVVEPVN